MKKYYFILALILLSLTACKKDKHINGTGTPPPQQQQLPPITTEGKNTFGCLVNGEVWLPEVTPYLMFVYPLQSSYQNNGFYIKATKRINNDIYQGLDIQIINLIIEQYYFLNSTSALGNWGAYSDLYKDCLYLTDTTQVGSVEILKLDIPNKIISGTFEMTLYKSWSNTDCDTIYITEGRFDVKFAQ
jgi:hypothetical protein